MSDTDGAAPAAPSTGELSIREAASLLGGQPPKKPEEQAPPPSRNPQERPDAPPEQSPPDEGDDVEPEEQAPDEDEAKDEAEEPPIQPPKSWPKPSREAFALLPREAQQEIVDTQNKRDADYQRGLRDAAQERQAAQAERQAAEQERQWYQQQLPALADKLKNDYLRDFGDIKSQADLDALRINDPMRWMAHKDALEAAKTARADAQAAVQQQHDRWWQQMAQYAEHEDQQLAKARPEFKDPVKSQKIGSECRSMLIDEYGFAEEEMNDGWSGQRMFSLRDHRWQMLIVDAQKYRAAQNARATTARQPVPPVQRPGTATNRGEAGNVSLKIASDRLTKTGRLEDAVAYQNLKSQIASRRR